MNRILLSLIAIVASGSASSLAQQIEPLKSQTRVYFNGYQSGSSFGQLGVSFARKCQLQSRSDVYLVGNELYATDRADCIAIVLNTSHPEASDAGPNWVNIQVTRYFESYDNAAVTIGRSGTFKRDGRVLPLLPSDGVAVPRAGLEAFDSVHAADTGSEIEDADALLGLPWHGSPDGNDAALTWLNRDQLQISKAFHPQVRLTARSLNTRLIRFTPGDKSGPLTIGQINRNGASVMVVKVFSPYSAEIGGTFGLVFETDPSRLEDLIANAKVPEPSCTGLSCLWAWLFPARAQ